MWPKTKKKNGTASPNGELERNIMAKLIFPNVAHFSHGGEAPTAAAAVEGGWLTARRRPQTVVRNWHRRLGRRPHGGT